MGFFPTSRTGPVNFSRFLTSPQLHQLTFDPCFQVYCASAAPGWAVEWKVGSFIRVVYEELWISFELHILFRSFFCVASTSLVMYRIFNIFYTAFISIGES